MLSRMLLHMIEAPLPIHRRLDWPQTHRCINKCAISSPSSTNLDYMRFANLPVVIRLTARRRIQRRPIQ